MSDCTVADQLHNLHTVDPLYAKSRFSKIIIIVVYIYVMFNAVYGIRPCNVSSSLRSLKYVDKICTLSNKKPEDQWSCKRSHDICA